MALFSERNGYKSKLKGPIDMPDGVRNRIWNACKEQLEGSREKNQLIKKSWTDFFKRPASQLTGITSYW